MNIVQSSLIVNNYRYLKTGKEKPNHYIDYFSVKFGSTGIADFCLPKME